MKTKMAFPGSHMQLRVEVRDIAPPIWRRLVVPADVALDELHEVLQIAFGWTDSHLHDFQVGEVRFAQLGDDDELFAVEERGAALGAIARQGSSFVYRYDFGDDWDHEILVEDITEPSRGPRRVECLDGARACPPEDCGGTHGYAELLRVLADPNDEEHASMKNWVGRGYAPDRFEIVKVNKKLGALARRLARPRSARRR